MALKGHCPSPRHDHSKRSKGFEEEGAAKDSLEYSHVPKICYSPTPGRPTSGGP